MPVDDQFWTKYLPPLGWNCRCTVVEVLKDSYPESNSDEATRAADSATSLPSQKIFRFNPGKELKVFPPKHPYLPKLDKCKTCKLGKNIGLSATGNEWCQTCGALKECQEKYGKIDWGQYKKNKEDYQKYKNNPDYYDVEFNEENGGLMATHTDHIVHDAPNEPTFFGNMTTTMLEKECQSELFRLGNKAILEKEKEKNANGDTLTALDLTLNKERVDIASITGNGYYGWQMYGKNDQLIRWNNRDDVTEPASSLILYFHNPESFSDEKMQMSIPFFKKQLEDNGFEQVLTKVYCVIKGNSKIIEYDI